MHLKTTEGSSALLFPEKTCGKSKGLTSTILEIKEGLLLLLAGGGTTLIEIVRVRVHVGGGGGGGG